LRLLAPLAPPLLFSRKPHRLPPLRRLIGANVGLASPLLAASELPFDFLQQRQLGRVNPGLRLVQVEEGGPVHFGEIAHVPRMRRPLHRERVAPDSHWITVARKRPGMDDLAALLLDWAQLAERALRLEAKLLLEFPLRRLEQVFAGVDFPLRDGPYTGVLACPQRPARMDKQEFQLALPDPIHDQPCAFLRHAENLHGSGAFGSSLWCDSYSVEALAAVRRLRVRELELAGREFRGAPKLIPVSQGQGRVGGRQGSAGCAGGEGEAELECAGGQPCGGGNRQRVFRQLDLDHLVRESKSWAGKVC